MVRDSIVAAVNDRCRGIGKFGQGWRELIVMAHGTDEADEGARLLRMIGEQPYGVEDLAEAAFQALRNSRASGGVPGSSSRTSGIRAIFELSVIW